MVDDRTSVESLDGQLITFDTHKDLDDSTLDQEKTVGFFSFLKDKGSLVCGLLTEVKHHIMQSVSVNSLEIRDLTKLLLQEELNRIII